MSDWIKLDEQWRQRSTQMFQRCVNEPNMTKAQLAWYTACQSEKRRLEWKYFCLQQEGRFRAASTANSERSLFITSASQYESHFH